MNFVTPPSVLIDRGGTPAARTRREEAPARTRCVSSAALLLCDAADDIRRIIPTLSGTNCRSLQCYRSYASSGAMTPIPVRGTASYRHADRRLRCGPDDLEGESSLVNLRDAPQGVPQESGRTAVAPRRPSSTSTRTAWSPSQTSLWKHAVRRGEQAWAWHLDWAMWDNHKPSRSSPGQLGSGCRGGAGNTATKAATCDTR